jgi:glutathionyl-hydroquinone reductase
MKNEIKKLNEIFAEKNAVEKALQALINKQREEAKKLTQKIFKPLENELIKYGFLLCPNGHNEHVSLSIFINLNKKDEQSLEINNFIISLIRGERDETFNKVICLTEEFLEKIQI